MEVTIVLLQQKMLIFFLRNYLIKHFVINIGLWMANISRVLKKLSCDNIIKLFFEPYSHISILFQQSKSLSQLRCRGYKTVASKLCFPSLSQGLIPPVWSLLFFKYIEGATFPSSYKGPVSPDSISFGMASVYDSLHFYLPILESPTIAFQFLVQYLANGQIFLHLNHSIRGSKFCSRIICEYGQFVYQYILIQKSIQMMQNSKREDVIIELGQEYIRVGIVGDKVPRKTIKASQYFNSQCRYGSAAFTMQLEELLFNIFFSFINCSSQGKTVILLEKVFTDRRIIAQMSGIMFRKLKIEKVELALSCVTPLYLTGRYSGVVVSAGASSVELMPVYDGYPLFRQFQSLRVGTQNLNSIIRDEIALLNKELSLDTLKQITDDQILESIKNPYCSLNASSNPITIAIRSKLRIKWVPDTINFSLFFGNPSNEEPNLAYSLLLLLNEVPVECLDSICGNVVLAGGFWRIKGMQKHFKLNILKYLDQFPRLQQLDVRSKLGFASWSFNPSELSWIGCSIGASIRNIDHLSLRRAQFIEEGFTEKIMEAYFLSG